MNKEVMTTIDLLAPNMNIHSNTDENYWIIGIDYNTEAEAFSDFEKIKEIDSSAEMKVSDDTDFVEGWYPVDFIIDTTNLTREDIVNISYVIEPN